MVSRMVHIGMMLKVCKAVNLLYFSHCSFNLLKYTLSRKEETLRNSDF